LVEEARKDKENASEHGEQLPEGGGRKAGTCFTCFTGTNVLGFIGTEVHKRQGKRNRKKMSKGKRVRGWEEGRYLLYFLYWHKNA
jgi:hypothetical protein